MEKSYILILSLIIFAIAGCNNSDDGYLKQQLIGEWEDELYTVTDQETSEELSYVSNYKFYNGSEFERTTSVLNNNGALLGYIRLTEGTFSVSDKDLRFNASIVYNTDEDTYANTIEELKAQNSNVIEGSKSEDYRMEFTNNFNSLTLYFDCPFNAVCAEYPELERLNF